MVIHVLLAASPSPTAAQSVSAKLPSINNMTQPAQEPPTTPKSGEISTMSGPETTATVEGDENIDSDKDVQVHTMAGTARKWLTYTYCPGTGST